MLNNNNDFAHLILTCSILNFRDKTAEIIELKDLYELCCLLWPVTEYIYYRRSGCCAWSLDFYSRVGSRTKKIGPSLCMTYKYLRLSLGVFMYYMFTKKYICILINFIYIYMIQCAKIDISLPDRSHEQNIFSESLW